MTLNTSVLCLIMILSYLCLNFLNQLTVSSETGKKHIDRFNGNPFYRFSIMQAENLVFYGYVTALRESGDERPMCKIVDDFVKRFKIDPEYIDRISMNYNATCKTIFQMLKEIK